MRLLLLFACACALFSADPPSAEISNGEIHAKLYLPDAENGYYRATRFDWSGIISSLTYKGHEYFGQWFPRYDPKINDAIMGPVEEFLTDNAGLWYADAKSGGTFVKIGVGLIRKPEETAFHQFNTYEIADPGKWSIRQQPDSVQFTQDLKGVYLYTKTVRLTKGKPQLVLEHSIKNVGTRAIDSIAYNHNFFVIDKQPSGPDFSVKFVFPPKATTDLKSAAEIRDNELHYLKELPNRESIHTNLEGFGNTSKDYNITVENKKVGAGVHITADRPLSNMVFWSIRNTLCPEAYVSMHIEPGAEYTWRITYDFYAN